MLRLFAHGRVRILLAGANGQFIRDIADFAGQKGTFTYGLGGDLNPGAYFLYLVVNGKVIHLQELGI